MNMGAVELFGATHCGPRCKLIGGPLAGAKRCPRALRGERRGRAHRAHSVMGDIGAESVRKQNTNQRGNQRGKEFQTAEHATVLEPRP